MRRSGVLRPAYLLALVAVVALSACAEETAGPQFANDELPTRPATATPLPSTPVAAPPTAAIATPASVSDLLRPRGAPGRIYFVADNTVWTVSSAGEPERTIDPAFGQKVLGIAAAPGADKVAVLLAERGDNGQSVEVRVLDDAGGEVSRFAGIPAGSGTPVPGQFLTGEAIDWSPQGDRLLVSLPGGIVVLATDPGAATPGPSVISGFSDDQVLQPAWSPTGVAIAFVSGEEGSLERSLNVLDVRSGEVAEVVVPPQGGFVVDFAWMPDGVTLLYTQGGQPGGVVSGIDLWRVNVDGSGRALVASAGTVAPVARVSTVRPAPDGRSIAYVVLVPGADRPRVDSLWLRDVTSGLGFRVNLSGIQDVEDLWWTDDGLYLLATAEPQTEQKPGLTMYHVAVDGSVKPIWFAPRPAGTPVASPIAGTPIPD